MNDHEKSRADASGTGSEGSQLYAWLVRASKCGIPSIEGATRVMTDYYEGVGPEPEYDGDGCEGAGQTAPESAVHRMNAGSQPLAAVGADDVLVISRTALMTLARQLMAEELDDCDEGFLAGRAHGIGSLHSEILMLENQAKNAEVGELAHEALSAVSWLYRRLPRGFGRQDHIEVVIERLARKTGTNISDLIERGPVEQTAELDDVERLS